VFKSLTAETRHSEATVKAAKAPRQHDGHQHGAKTCNDYVSRFAKLESADASQE